MSTPAPLPDPVTTRERAALTRLVAALLELAASGEPLRLEIELGGRLVRASIADAGEASPASVPPAPVKTTPAPRALALMHQADEQPDDWLTFSPLEEQIIALAPREGWITARAIASATKQPPDGDLPPILRNLVARKVLRSAQGRGYCINNND